MNLPSHRYLFKAKATTDNGWIQGLADFSHDGHIVIHPHPRSRTMVAKTIRADTLCQCTDSFDCAGNLIFERDIVRARDGSLHRVANGVFYPFDGEHIIRGWHLVALSDQSHLVFDPDGSNYEVAGNIIDLVECDEHRQKLLDSKGREF